MIKWDKKMTSLSTIEFMLVVIVGMVIGYSLTMVSLKTNKIKANENNYEVVDEDVQTIIDTYNYIMDGYYQEVNSDDLVNGAVKGMLESVGDPYTTYMETTTYDNFNITLNGSYEGLGVEISKYNDQIIIVGIFADSPAKEAGLELGDIIVSVDGKLSTEMSTSEFSQYVRNSDKGTFNMIINRNGEEKEYTLTRKFIELKSTMSKVFEEDNKKIGYIYMSIFATNSYSQFKKELSSLEEQNIDSLIIDLRDNSGGELTAATNIISLFVGSDKIIYQTEARDGTREKTFSKGTSDKEYPVVVLVNGNSASASEVMTAALKEDINAVVIGEKTYGKGTVQTLAYLPNGQQYKMTVKKWLTPNGNWINGEGIIPDIEVELLSDKDNQLEKAKEYLKKH